MSSSHLNGTQTPEQNMGIGLLMVESVRGGELKFMEELSNYYLSPIKVIYDRNTLRLDSSVKRMVKICIILISKVFPKHKHGIAATLSTLGMKLGPDNRRWFVSSSVSIPPRASRMLLYVHTTPRIFTSEYDYYLELYRNTSPIISLFLPLGKLIFNRLYGKSLKKASIVVCNSAIVKSRIRKYYGVDAVVLHPCVSVDNFNPGTFNRYFLYVSRYEPLKNHMFVIKAFDKFYSHRKNFKLILAGASNTNDVTTSYIDSLKSYVNDHKLPVEFIFNESHERIIELYRNCYTVLFAARNEDFGYIIIEGMACGKPVISINEGGPSEIIQNGSDGFLVNSIEEMTEKMLSLAESDMELGRISANARKTAVEHFSQGVFFARLNELLNSI